MRHSHRNKLSPARLRLPASTEKKPRWALRRWEYLFANWLLAEPKTPSKQQQIDAATRLANDRRPPGSEPVTLTYKQLQGLKARPDWQEYVEKVREGGLEAARSMFVSDMPLYVELHRWAAEHAKEAGDHRAMAQLTTPALDRIVSKREAVPLNVVQVLNITLSPKQLAVYNSSPVEVTAEVIQQENEQPRPAQAAST